MTDCYQELLALRTKHGTSELDRAIKKYNRSRLETDKPEKRRAVPRSWKIEAYAKQGGKCARCREPFDIREMEADHIIALAQGGQHKRHNIQMLCRECNRSKGANSLFRESKLGYGTVLEQLEGANGD